MRGFQWRHRGMFESWKAWNAFNSRLQEHQKLQQSWRRKQHLNFRWECIHLHGGHSLVWSKLLWQKANMFGTTHRQIQNMLMQCDFSCIVTYMSEVILSPICLSNRLFRHQFYANYQGIWSVKSSVILCDKWIITDVNLILTSLCLLEHSGLFTSILNAKI